MYSSNRTSGCTLEFESTTISEPARNYDRNINSTAPEGKSSIISQQSTHLHKKDGKTTKQMHAHKKRLIKALPAAKTHPSNSWIVVAFISLPVIIVLMSVPHINLMVGLLYERECPQIPSLTTYLVASGIVGVIAVIRWFYTGIAEHTSESMEYGLGMAEVALLALVDQKVNWSDVELQFQDDMEENYCNKNLFQYTSIMAQAILPVIVVFFALAFINPTRNPFCFWHETLRSLRRQATMPSARRGISVDTAWARKKKGVRKYKQTGLRPVYHSKKLRPSSGTTKVSHSSRSGPKVVAEQVGRGGASEEQPSQMVGVDFSSAV